MFQLDFHTKRGGDPFHCSEWGHEFSWRGCRTGCQLTFWLFSDPAQSKAPSNQLALTGGCWTPLTLAPVRSFVVPPAFAKSAVSMVRTAKLSA